MKLSSHKGFSFIVLFRQIFNVVVAVFQSFHNSDFVYGLGRCQRGVIFRGNRAENTHLQSGGDFCGGESLEFRDTLAPVAVIDDFAPETFPVHEAAQEEVAHNLFAVKHEEREKGPVPDDFRKGFLVEGVGLEELEGFFGLFGEEGCEGGCVGGGCHAKRELSGAFFQDSGDFPEGVPVGEREHEGVAPFDDVPEEPEPVAENVGQLVEHQQASAMRRLASCCPRSYCSRVILPLASR